MARGKVAPPPAGFGIGGRDLSYTTDDDTVPSIRTPEDEAQTRTAHAQARAFEQNLHDRDTREAENYGVPFAVWQTMSEAQRAQVMALQPKGYVHPQDRGYVDMGEATGFNESFEERFRRARSRLITPAEEKDYIVLCDPVKHHARWGLYTPSLSKVSRRDLANQLEKGFTIDPQAPPPPEPTLRCSMRNLDGDQCEFAGYEELDDPDFSNELEIHQAKRHPSEYEARKAMAVRSQRELERARWEEDKADRARAARLQEMQIAIMAKQLGIALPSDTPDEG